MLLRVKVGDEVKVVIWNVGVIGARVLTFARGLEITLVVGAIVPKVFTVLTGDNVGVWGAKVWVIGTIITGEVNTGCIEGIIGVSVGMDAATGVLLIGDRTGVDVLTDETGCILNVPAELTGLKVRTDWKLEVLAVIS